MLNVAQRGFPATIRSDSAPDRHSLTIQKEELFSNDDYEVAGASQVTDGAVEIDGVSERHGRCHEGHAGNTMTLVLEGAVAQFAEAIEKDGADERVAGLARAGLASARARGRHGGRPFKMTPAKLRLAQAAMGQPETKVSELCADRRANAT